MIKSPTSSFPVRLLSPARLPRQIQRAVPIYLALVFVFIFFWKAEYFAPSLKPTDLLKHVLDYQYPLKQPTKSAFPKKIWQTWKIDPLEFEERDHIRARSWTALNPSYRYEVLTDGNDLHYVETHFGPNALDRPDIIYIYRTLTATIIKADLLRYLILYVEGGVYADIDVEALVPIDRWIPFHFDEGDADLVISVEIDEPTYSNHTILGPKSQSFCQWTIMSKPRNPAMLRIINNVVAWLADTARKQNVSISEITLNFDDVLNGTGPSAFTSAILAEMAHQTGHTVKWMDTFFNITEPRLIGNILVLTVEGFAAGQGHSHSHTHDHPQALVKHHYHASLWPTRHPRFSHPAYGVVEECNWNPECVAEWDKNTAEFPFLSEEDKNKAIAAKEQANQEKQEREDAVRADADKVRMDREAKEQLEMCMKVIEASGGMITGIERNNKPEAGGEGQGDNNKPPEEQNQEGWHLLQDGETPPGTEPAQKPEVQQPEEKKPEDQKPEPEPPSTEPPSPLLAKIETKP